MLVPALLTSAVCMHASQSEQTQWQPGVVGATKDIEDTDHGDGWAEVSCTSIHNHEGILGDSVYLCTSIHNHGGILGDSVYLELLQIV